MYGSHTNIFGCGLPETLRERRFEDVGAPNLQQCAPFGTASKNALSNACVAENLGTVTNLRGSKWVARDIQY